MYGDSNFRGTYILTLLYICHVNLRYTSRNIMFSINYAICFRSTGVLCMYVFCSYAEKPAIFCSEIREVKRSINTYNMRYYFPQHVLLCTRTVHNQSGDICIQGYLRILRIGNGKSLKVDNIHNVMFYF